MDNLFRQFGMRRDKLGVMAPMGSGSDARDLFRLGKGGIDVAEVLLRARFTKEEGSTASIVGYYGWNHKPTQVFLDLMVASSLCEGGAARGEYLMGFTGMVVPSAMPVMRALSGNGHKKPSPQGQTGNQAQDNE